MKTPEEIKSDAATCLTLPPHAMCDRFELNKKCKGDCRYVIKELYDLVLHYESRLAQVERERDAAVEALDEIRQCKFCKHYTKKLWEEPCLSCDLQRKTNYEWRGVCAENTKENEHHG